MTSAEEKGGRTRAAVMAMTALLLVATACGNRVGHDKIVQAARPIVVNGGSGATAGGAGAGGGSLALTPGANTAATIAAGGAGGSAGGSGGGSGAAVGATPNAGGSQPQPITGGTLTGSEVVLGNVGNYDGIPGSVLANAQPMLQVWAKWVNAHGGLNGHPVRVISGDDGGDPSRNLSLVRTMVENDHAVAFIANMVPLSVSGSLDYLQQHQIPVIGGDVVTAQWNQSPMLFPQGTAIDNVILDMAAVAVKYGAPRIGVIYCAEAAFVCSNFNHVLVDSGGAAKEGATVVYDAQVSLAQPDFTNECLQAKNKGVQTLVIATDPNSINRLSHSCAAQGFHPRYETASLAVSPVEQNNADLVGMISPVQTFPWMSSSAGASAYAQAVSTYDPGLVTSATTSEVWVAGLLVQRVSSFLTANPASADFLKGLWSLRNETLGGLAPPLTFSQGQPAPAASCYFVVQMDSSQHWAAPNGLSTAC